ncbi:Protein of unknown function [Jatrophihabitans endophyticus]|uniref:DUF2993 domain-containing protein n=1 Tax=Jatrophihabitans endophyticus TaxID=1206085 RepID=A0A1M5C821_9ACTN|nr:DUF2993 domain-containing protein [Jatrophihabitans endophyticus]SHF50810.1 Protein of unknown function [Jatrophihabitans endophyticus]
MSYGDPAAQQWGRPPPRRSGGRSLRRVLIAVLVLVVLLIAADRVGDVVAQKVAATALRQSQHLGSEPDVDIGGFPFLTQFARGRYDHITVTAADVPVGDDDVRLTLSRLRVVLDDLTVSRDFADYHAEHATAVGTIGYAQLSDALRVDVSYAGHGRIRARKQITVFGQTFTPTITAAPVLTNGALSFAKAQVNGLGDLAAPVSQVLSQVFDVAVPLRNIPFDVDVQRLSMAPDGLRIDLVGSDVTYHRENG